MYEFIRIQYAMGRITDEQLSELRVNGYITAEQEKELLAKSAVK